MAPVPIPLPRDVLDFLGRVFGEVNDRVSRKMSNMPTIHEPSLDMSVIEALSHHSAPFQLNSGWTIRLDTHYLGGGGHFGSWEVADIGMLVLFRNGGRIVRSKVGLLQSKRLYPIEQPFDEDEVTDYLRGFGRLYEDRDSYLAAARPRTLSFAKRSQYKVLHVSDRQWQTIEQYETRHGIPVYYLLYHPLRIPSKRTMPLTSTRAPYGPNRVGARVVPASAMRDGLAKRNLGYVPSYGDLEFLLPAPFDIPDNAAGWRLEDFVAELLVTCEEGYIAEDRFDDGLMAVFSRRAGPISCCDRHYIRRHLANDWCYPNPAYPRNTSIPCSRRRISICFKRRRCLRLDFGPHRVGR